jgi:hypothetical protein
MNKIGTMRIEQVIGPMAAGAAELPSFLAAPMPAEKRNVKSGLPRIKKRLSAA